MVTVRAVRVRSVVSAAVMAIRAVRRILRIDLEPVLIHMAFVRMVKVAVVQEISVAVVLDSSVTAVKAVLMWDGSRMTCCSDMVQRNFSMPPEHGTLALSAEFFDALNFSNVQTRASNVTYDPGTTVVNGVLTTREKEVRACCGRSRQRPHLQVTP